MWNGPCDIEPHLHLWYEWTWNEILNFHCVKERFCTNFNREYNISSISWTVIVIFLEIYRTLIPNELWMVASYLMSLLVFIFESLWLARKNTVGCTLCVFVVQVVLIFPEYFPDICLWFALWSSLVSLSVRRWAQTVYSFLTTLP